MNTIIKEFVESAKEKYNKNIIKMILFGSYARGNAQEDSDIDILVVWKGKNKEKHV